MPGSIQSIERAAAVLRVLAAGAGELRLNEVVSALGLAKGTVHGILHTLVEVGFVDQDRDTGKYTLGPGLTDLRLWSIDANELRARSMNWADPLAARVGAVVRVGVLDAGEVLVVHYVFRPDGSPQHADVGARLPAHATAPGKVLLAYLPGALPDRPLAYTPRTIIGRARLASELVMIRERGYAVEFGEYAAGAASIAAPIFGTGGVVAGAVSVHGDVDQLCDTAGAGRGPIVAQVVDCARNIAREIAAEDPWRRVS
jgi:DNA-binding IclR family transcriptional regulator